MYDKDKLSSRDLYDVFLSGPVSVLTVENPAANTDKELIVFRDSFGSSMVPLLIPGYAKVTLVDIRYLPADKLGEFVEFGNQDVLFERFYRSDASRNSATGGSGIGLSVAKAVAEAHHGKLTAESKDGKSLTITLTVGPAV